MPHITPNLYLIAALSNSVKMRKEEEKQMVKERKREKERQKEGAFLDLIGLIGWTAL